MSNNRSFAQCKIIDYINLTGKRGAQFIMGPVTPSYMGKVLNFTFTYRKRWSTYKE